MNTVIERAESIDPKLAAHIRGLGGMDLLATSNLFLAEQGKNGFRKWINEGGGAELKNEATGYTLNVLRTKGDTEAAKKHRTAALINAAAIVPGVKEIYTAS